MWCLVAWLAALSLSGGVAALSGPTDAVRSLLHSSPRASSVAIDAALDALANPTDRPAFASRGALAAGTWRVVHAPHIGTLGRTLGGLRFDVTYELDDADRMTSHVRYTLALPGAAGGDRATAWTTGWLSTAGTWEVRRGALRRGVLMVEVMSSGPPDRPPSMLKLLSCLFVARSRRSTPTQCA